MKNVDTAKTITHISLCTGYGGIDLGLSRVIRGFRTVCYVEIEAFAIANLVSKIEAGFLDVAPIWSNLKTFPWDQFREKVDILSGGFPCQPFSAAGRRAGDKDPRHLWPYIVTGIKRLGFPSIVFFENVEGIITSKLRGQWADEEGCPVLLHVLRELERLGYKATAGLFTASETGAPHQRKRVFIMGVQTNCKTILVNTFDNESQTSINLYNRKKNKEREATRATRSSNHFPASRGSKQFEWEPPRTIKPKMGGNTNGFASGLGYVELCESLDNRVDELRLLGNGVVPATAKRAFRTLWSRLAESCS